MIHMYDIQEDGRVRLIPFISTDGTEIKDHLLEMTSETVDKIKKSRMGVYDVSGNTVYSLNTDERSEIARSLKCRMSATKILFNSFEEATKASFACKEYMPSAVVVYRGEGIWELLKKDLKRKTFVCSETIRSPKIVKEAKRGAVV